MPGVIAIRKTDCSIYRHHQNVGHELSIDLIDLILAAVWPASQSGTANGNDGLGDRAPLQVGGGDGELGGGQCTNSACADSSYKTEQHEIALSSIANECGSDGMKLLR